jgi:hypothetical protein
VVEADRPEDAAADAQAQTDVAIGEFEPSAIEDADTGRETPAPAELPVAELPVDEPAVDELAGTEPPIAEPLDEPAPCDPPTPYLFATAAGDPLELERCTVGEAGEAELLSAPALSNSLVRMVQQALLAAGYDPGPIDGLIGPRTRAAVRQLQRDNGLTADGIISFAVLDLLQE